LTFLFTDIEGSTALLKRVGADTYATVLVDHHRIIRAGLSAHGGKEIDTQGDGFFAVFSSPSACVAAVIEMQRAISAHQWPAGEQVRVRMGVHSGEASENSTGLVGLDIHRAARIAAVAHGDQVVLSTATAALVSDSLPDGATFGDLGFHRLKDLGRPERIFQLQAEGLRVEFPPLRSLDNPELGNNLPQQLTSFMGREKEMAVVRDLLKKSRLVTLAGAGGVGKSRLAVQVAAELLDGSGNGVWLVELAPLSDPDIVPQALASVLSVREDSSRSVLDTVLDVLRDRNLLVVLDNCEHLIAACAKMANAVLRSCPGIVILATSREPLGIEGEHVYRVPSLSLPPVAGVETPEALLASEAVQLFVGRAGSSHATFVLDAANAAAVRSICRRLDGIPLALELAASRIGSLSVTDIETRLDDRFRLLTTRNRTALARQQTLRALIDWSYDLLVEPEQVLLSRSSVFAGGFTLESAEGVCAEVDIESAAVMDLLTSLVDKSLIQADSSEPSVRYQLLETIRQYAREKLAELGETEAVRCAHARTFLALAEEAALHFKGPNLADWLDRIDLERDNLRATAACFLGDPDATEEALRLGIALRRYWDVRGPLGEAVDTIEAALVRTESDGPTSLRAEAMATAADIEDRVGLRAQSRLRAEEGLVIARRVGDPGLTAHLLSSVVLAAFRQGDLDPVIFEYADESVELARASGDPDVAGVALAMRAVALHANPSRARADNAEALSLFQAAGDQRWAGIVLNNLAVTEMVDGDFAAARAHLEEALVIAEDVGDVSRLPLLGFNFGLAACLEGDHLVARSSFTDALIHANTVGARTQVALAIFGLALCSTVEGDALRSVSLHGAAQGILELNGEVLEPLEARMAEEDLNRLKDRIEPKAFATAFEHGRQLTAQGAIALALWSSEGA